MLFKSNLFSSKFNISRQVGVVIVAAIMLTVFQLTAPTTYAQSLHSTIPMYSCGNLQPGNHCYGEMYWPGGIQGEKTDIKVERINCGCDGFLNAEMWVQSQTGCSPNCWVEAGTKDETGYGYTFSFWADERPNGGGYTNHYMNGFIQGDYDHDTTFRIFSIGNQEFRVDKAPAGVNGCTAQCSATWIQYSTNNAMVPNYITLGEELAGSSGASSPNIHFTYNYYYDGRIWKPQGSGNPGAKVIQYQPPYAYWLNGVVGGPTGGDLITYCC